MVVTIEPHMDLLGAKWSRHVSPDARVAGISHGCHTAATDHTVVCPVSLLDIGTAGVLLARQHSR